MLRQLLSFRPSSPFNLFFAFLGVFACASGGGDILGASTPNGTSYSAVDIVSAANYSALTIEVDVMADRDVAGALAYYEADLQALMANGWLQKPGGLDIVMDQAISSTADPNRYYSYEEAKALVAEHRSVEPASDSAGLYILFADGQYKDDDSDNPVMSIAYGGSVIVVFYSPVEVQLMEQGQGRGGTAGPAGGGGAGNSPNTTVRDLSVSNVLMHESGHLFGLVNNGLDMVSAHQDAEYGAHDDDADCIMYWLNNRVGISDVIAESINNSGDTSTISFCPSCLDDMKSVHVD